MDFLCDLLYDWKVFVVGHDWGASVAWNLCLFRPDKVKALVNTSVQFSPRNPARKPLESMRFGFGDDYYICRFQVCLNLVLSRFTAQFHS